MSSEDSSQGKKPTSRHVPPTGGPRGEHHSQAAPLSSDNERPSDMENRKEEKPLSQSKQYPWWSDLDASRNISSFDKNGFEMILSWFEGWRLWHRENPGQQAARKLWKEQVLQRREREEWQKTQWAAAFRWYLQWLEFCRQTGKSSQGLAEKVRDSVENTAARRGLAYRTRLTYGAWCARFAQWTGSRERVLDEAVARDWLSYLVNETAISFSTQKNALNSVVFLYKDVCGVRRFI